MPPDPSGPAQNISAHSPEQRSVTGQRSPELLLAAQTELGECPVWDAPRQTLWFVDITSRQLHSLRWDRTMWNKQTLPALGGGLVLGHDGMLITCLQTGIYRCDPDAKELTLLCDPQQGKPNHRLNEAKCDTEGRLWVGSMSTLGRFPTGCLYRQERSGVVATVLEGISVPNTLAWMPDNEYVVFADSARRTIWRFRYDPCTGDLRDRTVFADCAADRGMPDGAAVDVEGYVWVAEFGGGRVKRFAPDGRVVRTIELPATQVTSCAFAGESLTQLVIITTKRLLDPESRARQTHAGDLFLAEVDTPGLPPHLYCACTP